MEVLDFFKPEKKQDFIKYPLNPEIEIPKIFNSPDEYWSFLDKIFEEYNIELKFNYNIDDRQRIIVNEKSLLENAYNGENGCAILGNTIAGQNMAIEADKLPICVVIGQGMFFVNKLNSNSKSIILYEADKASSQVLLKKGEAVLINNSEKENLKSLNISNLNVHDNHLLIKFTQKGKIEILDTASDPNYSTMYYSYKYNNFAGKK
ncbi:MAG: hypothetical protein AAGF07_01355 [Patescibacteria group bacterium]